MPQPGKTGEIPGEHAGMEKDAGEIFLTHTRPIRYDQTPIPQTRHGVNQNRRISHSFYLAAIRH